MATNSFGLFYIVHIRKKAWPDKVIKFKFLHENYLSQMISHICNLLSFLGCLKPKAAIKNIIC